MSKMVITNTWVQTAGTWLMIIITIFGAYRGYVQMETRITACEQNYQQMQKGGTDISKSNSQSIAVLQNSVNTLKDDIRYIRDRIDRAMGHKPAEPPQAESKVIIKEDSKG